MKHLRFLAAVGTALLLSGCVQPQSEKAHRDTLLAPVPDSASGYRAIAMAGGSEKAANIGIDFDKLGKDQDLRVALMYGVDATASLMPKEDKAEAGLKFSGAGDSWQRPIVVRGQEKALTTVANAYRYIESHFPHSKILASTLYAGPPPNFVTRVEFGSEQGDQALYFDLTEWAKAWQTEVPN